MEFIDVRPGQVRADESRLVWTSGSDHSSGLMLNRSRLSHVGLGLWVSELVQFKLGLDIWANISSRLLGLDRPFYEVVVRALRTRVRTCCEDRDGSAWAMGPKELTWPFLRIVSSLNYNRKSSKKYASLMDLQGQAALSSLERKRRD
ncbi:hypothetical protein V6N13_049543 [Hibiscus sabdariffa]|uniref:Uncharacterized protein n=1 Tax=Hibiscus sabdariffa TaxID=183260 RepID=A0ABR2QWU6_9ROSI